MFRLFFTQYYLPLSRWNETLIAVTDCSLLNEKSYKNAGKTVLAQKKCLRRVLGNNLMMTLYFSCLLECTELLIVFLVWRHFSKVFFRDGHDKLALTLNLFFIAFFGYSCTLIFRGSLSSFRFFHTHCLQLVCDNVAFTLLNIRDNSVVINKLRQDKSGQALRCSGERFC